MVGKVESVFQRLRWYAIVMDGIVVRWVYSRYGYGLLHYNNR